MFSERNSNQRHDGIGFYGNSSEPLIDESSFDRDISAVKRARLADLEVDDEVVVAVGLHQVRIRLQRLEAVDNRRQRLVIDDDRGGCIHSLVACFANRDRNRIADEQDCFRRQARTRRHALELEVVGAEDPDHARHRGGKRHVEAFDASVRDRGPHEDCVKASIEPHVVRVKPGAGDEARVLAPADDTAQRGIDRHLARALPGSRRSLLESCGR
jgi:hypothetical protein